MSFTTRFRQGPDAGPAADAPGPATPGIPEPDDHQPDDRTPGPAEPAADAPRPAWRRVLAATLTALAAVLVLLALLLPDQLTELVPVAFLRLPAEALVLVAVALVLPARARVPVAVLVGLGLGLLTVLKFLDMGFSSVLSRPFDPVLDWVLFDDALTVLAESDGDATAIGAAVGAIVLAVAVLALMMLAALRLTRVLRGHRAGAARSVAVLVPVWLACAVLGAQVPPGLPVASADSAVLAWERAITVGGSLGDRYEFAAQMAVDPYRDVPPEQLLTGLRGKDVVLAFVESYGRDAVQNPEYAGQVGAVLDAGTARLAEAGYSARSAFLTSPTAGGGSWLAHSTLLSGTWVDNQQRYETLLASDRMTLTHAFHRADWRTVGVMPGITEDWPEGAYYGYDKLWDLPGLAYRGPNFGWAPVPDQFTMEAFQRAERSQPDHPPVMAEIALVASHWPWAPIPRELGWNELGDGSVFLPQIAEGLTREYVWADPARVRTEYRRSIEYSLNTLISYVQTYGDDDLVLVFLGDHQPTTDITGPDASRDVPITVVTRDPQVLDRMSGWGWDPGLRPNPGAPVAPMDAFRDRFLSTFGPQQEPDPILPH